MTEMTEPSVDGDSQRSRANSSFSVAPIKGTEKMEEEKSILHYNFVEAIHPYGFWLRITAPDGIFYKMVSGTHLDINTVDAYVSIQNLL